MSSPRVRSAPFFRRSVLGLPFSRHCGAPFLSIAVLWVSVVAFSPRPRPFGRAAPPFLRGRGSGAAPLCGRRWRGRSAPPACVPLRGESGRRPAGAAGCFLSPTHHPYNRRRVSAALRSPRCGGVFFSLGVGAFVGGFPRLSAPVQRCFGAGFPRLCGRAGFPRGSVGVSSGRCPDLRRLFLGLRCRPRVGGSPCAPAPQRPPPSPCGVGLGGVPPSPRAVALPPPPILGAAPSLGGVTELSAVGVGSPWGGRRGRRRTALAGKCAAAPADRPPRCLHWATNSRPQAGEVLKNTKQKLKLSFWRF